MYFQYNLFDRFDDQLELNIVNFINTIINRKQEMYLQSLLSGLIKDENDNPGGLDFDIKIDIFVNSQGGFEYVATTVAHLLNAGLEQGLTIRLIGIEDVSSAALDLFLRFKGEKIIKPYTMGILHLSDKYASSRDLNDSDSLSSISVAEQKRKAKSELKIYKPHLSDEHYELLKKGKDVILRDKELQVLVNNLSIKD